MGAYIGCTTQEHYGRLRGLLTGVVTQGGHKLTEKEFMLAVMTLGSYKSLMALLERSSKMDRQQIATMQVQDAALQQLESKLSSSKQELEVYLSKQTPAKIWDTFTIRMTAMESFRRQIMTDFMAKVDRGTASEASSSTPSTPMRGQQGDSGSVASIGLSNFINAKPSTMGQDCDSVSLRSTAPRPWHINLDDVHFKDELGAGVLGSTFSGEWEAMQVAVKMIPQASLPEDFTAEVFDDLLEVLYKAQHPMLCKLLGACYTNNRGLLIYELHETANSIKKLAEKQPENLDFFAVAVQIAEGLRYIHSSKLRLHGNLRGSNVLITDTGFVKILDYGLVELTQGRIGTAQADGLTTAGSRWMAPEAITTGKLTPRSDIYSLGILLWELLTKDVSYKSLERHGVLPLDAISHAVKNLILPKVPVGTPPGVEKLIQSCWNPVEANRPTAETVLSQLRLLSNTLGEAELQFVNQQHWGTGVQDHTLTMNRALFH
eukprot:jgi/Tetstr1/423686/TSEL_014320.t1